ncbi:hypothetical protein PFNF54_05364 [Plasmodium falciparum NF54]|uniref:Uncharacterized protein n=1 Tax=Plasmodium falciparum (isolate NF54) TaxID=5843 RepID=W7JLC3_PLAFO|nr:hypothetical protein PFNF54_05364 [Plasmodium falciparum NF54]
MTLYSKKKRKCNINFIDIELEAFIFGCFLYSWNDILTNNIIYKKCNNNKDEKIINNNNNNNKINYNVVNNKKKKLTTLKSSGVNKRNCSSIKNNKKNITTNHIFYNCSAKNKIINKSNSKNYVNNCNKYKEHISCSINTDFQIKHNIDINALNDKLLYFVKINFCLNNKDFNIFCNLYHFYKHIKEDKKNEETKLLNSFFKHKVVKCGKKFKNCCTNKEDIKGHSQSEKNDNMYDGIANKCDDHKYDKYDDHKYDKYDDHKYDKYDDHKYNIHDNHKYNIHDDHKYDKYDDHNDKYDDHKYNIHDNHKYNIHDDHKYDKYDDHMYNKYDDHMYNKYEDHMYNKYDDHMYNKYDDHMYNKYDDHVYNKRDHLTYDKDDNILNGPYNNSYEERRKLHRNSKKNKNGRTKKHVNCFFCDIYINKNNFDDSTKMEKFIHSCMNKVYANKKCNLMNKCIINIKTFDDNFIHSTTIERLFCFIYTHMDKNLIFFWFNFLKVLLNVTIDKHLMIKIFFFFCKKNFLLSSFFHSEENIINHEFFSKNISINKPSNNFIIDIMKPYKCQNITNLILNNNFVLLQNLLDYFYMICSTRNMSFYDNFFLNIQMINFIYPVQLNVFHFYYMKLYKKFNHQRHVYHQRINFKPILFYSNTSNIIILMKKKKQNITKHNYNEKKQKKTKLIPSLDNSAIHNSDKSKNIYINNTKEFTNNYTNSILSISKNNLNNQMSYLNKKMITNEGNYQNRATSHSRYNYEKIYTRYTNFIIGKNCNMMNTHFNHFNITYLNKKGKIIYDRFNIKGFITEQINKYFYKDYKPNYITTTTKKKKKKKKEYLHKSGNNILIAISMNSYFQEKKNH